MDRCSSLYKSYYGGGCVLYLTSLFLAPFESPQINIYSLWIYLLVMCVYIDIDVFINSSSCFIL